MMKSKPAAQSQYVECVYIGGSRIAISGMPMQGTNWTKAYGRRSSKKLQKKKAPLRKNNLPNKPLVNI